MIVRIVTYGAGSLEEVREWTEERSPAVENIHGLRRVEFVRRNHPPRAGAIMYFESPQDLQDYKESRRYEDFRTSMRKEWGEKSVPVREDVYRVLEISQ